MSKFVFSKELVDAVVRYLASRPYAEVAGLLERMNEEAAPQLKAQPQQLAVAETPNEQPEAEKSA